ncbi:FAD-dependent monooxygenase [Halocalculus aciditolerans]|uniref:Thioredoxin reductase n=1 Tax=Halocalculus aciditolerans TaxID=1383812 RepID=A0A830F7P7_9EURY|nr:FAD-dependent monooxygenase [Halocalculus aciditolerans]GGL48787.1 thioredoxin reductase [Halocalculus aciditolerans]
MTGDAFDVDVVVVGGGPSGCSAGVFLARYGFETRVFDRGVAALPRSAFLANYPGFPAGIDIETFTDLLHDHAETAGCDVVPDMVESVDHGESEGFVVETQEGREVAARYVVAASWYDGEYLRPLTGGEAFEAHEHDGDEHEHFDPDYVDADGRTPVDGLYVVAPAGQRNAQAVVAAGQGAHVARRLIKDDREREGYPPALAEHYDWLRSESEFTGDWAERPRWREWFESEIPEDYEPAEGVDLDELRETYIDAAFETKRTDEAVEALRERAHRRLLDHLDDDVIKDYLAERDERPAE